ncbi:MAG TPA: aminotransferase class V-fold PLP-dependent enzyme [Lutibacter sp.]|nr:aminotransferase class V-fold PLP-dependent enzyme [Lutibacter sp.]
MTKLEKHFKKFRDNIIGKGQTFTSPYGEKEIVYTDWTASARLYAPIEEKMINDFGPYVANTHTETSFTGSVMTQAYHKAREIIKEHVNASDTDVLIMEGSGMTGVINKFQRILGLKIPELLQKYATIPDEIKPVVFISHMEHHSNQTSWLETIADVVVLPYDKQGLIDCEAIQPLFDEYANRSLKIVSITAGSNVTGIQTDYHRIAKLAHENKGLCFVDFACTAPYVKIDMHPDDTCYLDAIFFSPHKFLGGPGTQGVLIFNEKLYKNIVPDNPGGGTVVYTNPWGEHDYVKDIEIREDGGTPGFLQTIRTALAIQLKDEMGVANIHAREEEINKLIFNDLNSIPNLHMLAKQHTKRLGIFSFFIDDVHFNLVVKLLNDRFGIQTRGGCSCAGTYGHFLLHIDNKTSREIEEDIKEGKLLDRPGWVRMSIHPTTSCEEVQFVCKSIRAVAENHKEWSKDYEYVSKINDYIHKSKPKTVENLVDKLF